MKLLIPLLGVGVLAWLASSPRSNADAARIARCKQCRKDVAQAIEQERTNFEKLGIVGNLSIKSCDCPEGM